MVRTALDIIKDRAKQNKLSEKEIAGVAKYEEQNGVGSADIKLAQTKMPELQVPKETELFQEEAPKILKATKENPVIERGSVENPIVQETPQLEFNKDNYDNIRVKGMIDPKSITAEERNMLARVKVQLSDGKDINQVFGIETPKASLGLSATVTDSIARDLMGKDTINSRLQLREGGYSDEQISDILDKKLQYDKLDRSYAKQRTSLIQERADTRTAITEKYSKLDEIAKSNAKRAKNSAQRQASLYGTGRSTATEKIMADLENQTSDLLNSYALQKSLEQEKLDQQIQGAENEVIQNIEAQIEIISNRALQQQTLIDEQSRAVEQDLNQNYIDEAKKLLESSGVDTSSIDMDVTLQSGDGYYRNVNGDIVLGEDGLPLEYKSLETRDVEDAVDGFLEQYEGVSIPNSREGMVDSIRKYMKEGFSLGEIMDELNTEVQNSEDYVNQKNSDFMGIEDTIDLGSSIKVFYKNGETEILNKSDGWKELNDDTLYNENSGEYKSINTDGNLGDMRNLASQFPGQAWAKNNNPAGITWNANFDNPKAGTTAQRLIDAGVNFSKGTSRPAAEGGNYVTFDTMEDGLKAQRILMSGTYGDSTVGGMLQSWVGTSEGPNYAKQVAGNAGIDLNTKVSDLSDTELQSLQSAKIQKESPGLYGILSEYNGESTQDKKQLFTYADTLTATDRSKFLKEKGIEDDYIRYKADINSKDADFSDIEAMTDVNFADKTTEFKTKSFSFGTRMKDAEDSIEEMAGNFSKWYSGAGREFVGGILPNNFKTKDRQKFEQAERNFINAVLRQESGAAIADSEFKNAKKQYMPQPGDSKAVLEQKKENREMAVENMYRNSGKDSKGRNIVDIYKQLGTEVVNDENGGGRITGNTGGRIK